MGNFKSVLWLSLAGSLALAGCDGKTDTTPDDLPVVNLSLSSSTVEAGQAATLQWNVTGAYSCTATGDWPGITTPGASAPRGTQGTESTGAMTVPGTYSYTLTCTGPGGSQSVAKPLTVTAAGAPSVSLSVSPLSVNVGQSATLQWTSSRVSSCVVSGRWQNLTPTNTSDPRALSGTESTGTLNTAGTYAYAITCQATNGTTVSDDVALLVGQVAAPTVSLNLSSNNIPVGQSASLTWSSSNATSCTTIGNWLNPGARPTTSAAPESIGTPAAGTYTYSLNCSGPGGSVTSAPRTLTVSTPNVTPVSVTISVAPASIAPNATATLSWSSVGAIGNCTASGAWSGSKAPSGTATVTPSSSGIYSYVLSCSGASGDNDAKSATLAVGNVPAPIFTTPFSVSPATVNSGSLITLNWAVSNASSCQASGSWTGSRGVSGTETIIAGTPGIASYVLTCTGPGGTVSAPPQSVTVTSGGSSPVISFNCTGGNAFVIPEKGESTSGTTNLCWSVSPNIESVSCTAFGDWSGPQNRNGSVTLGAFTTPGTYNYALQCVNSATGETKLEQQQITVTPLTTAKPRVTLFATPLSVPFGGTTQLDWTASNNAVAPCVASVDWTGNKQLTGNEFKDFNAPGVFNYVLTCSNPAGSARSGVIVEAKGPAANVEINAVPNTVAPDGQSTLSWTSQGVTNCTATGDWSGTKDISSGGVSTGVLSQTRTYIYGLSCTGPGGQDDDFVAVTVTTPAAPTLSLVTDTPVINPGESARLSWTSTNATECHVVNDLGDWNGGQSLNSNGFFTVESPLTAVGSYSYDLQCSGAGGSVTKAVTVKVILGCQLLNTVQQNVRNKALLEPNASVQAGWDAVLCVNCNVNNRGSVVTPDQNDHATINLPVGLIAAAQLTVTDNVTTYDAGMQFGYVVAVPSALLSADLLKDLSLTTYLNGVPQESFQNPELLDLDLLALLGNPGRFFVNAVATKPFDGMRLTKSSLLSALPQTYVYGACVVIPESVSEGEEEVPPL